VNRKRGAIGGFAFFVLRRPVSPAMPTAFSSMPSALLSGEIFVHLRKFIQFNFLTL
jgi:hypothetical protein